MEETTRNRIAQLNKSATNLQNARNQAQRAAHSRFLVQRGKELSAAQRSLAAWLAEADDYINTHCPEINADPDAEYNREWIRKLHEYQDISNALQAAWDALMASKERAA